MHVSILPQTFLPSSLPHNTELCAMQQVLVGRLFDAIVFVVDVFILSPKK